MNKMKLLKYAETKLYKDEPNNGTCLGIELKNLTEENYKDKIDLLIDNYCYRYNSAIISKDSYGVDRLIFFSK